MSKKQQIPVCPNENKVNYGEPRAKNPVSKFYNKNQVRHVTFKEVEKKDQNKPVKMLDESVAKRKALGFTGSGIICFLCGSTRHVAPHCSITPCKCGLFHSESAFKGRGNNSQQAGRVVRN